MDYPAKYDGLIDDETWAFIRETETWYPPDAVDYSVAEQRKIYDRMCRSFHHGYPKGVTATDSVIAKMNREIPVRNYIKQDTVSEAHIVYFHGGGFVVGGLESHDDVCAELCERTGFSVTSVDYRLAPEHVFPADFDDALDAFTAVAERVSLPIVVCGDSAGGNLAAAVSHVTRGGVHAPIGQVLIYPGLGSDLTWGTFVEHADAPMLTTKDTTFYKSIRTGGDEDALKQKNCTPLNDDDFSGLPPTVVVSAQCDPLCGDGKVYCERIAAEGGKSVWFNEKGLVHGYLRARHSVERARNSFTRIVGAVEALGHGKWLY